VIYSPHATQVDIATIPLAGRHTSFSCGVLHVDLGGAPEKMCGTATPSIVAGMTGHLFRAERTVCQLEDKLAGVNSFAWNNAESTIAAIQVLADPRPAAIGVAPVNERPESLFSGWHPMTPRADTGAVANLGIGSCTEVLPAILTDSLNDPMDVVGHLCFFALVASGPSTRQTRRRGIGASAFRHEQIRRGARATGRGLPRGYEHPCVSIPRATWATQIERWPDGASGPVEVAA
jgi:hypothetical protein